MTQGCLLCTGGCSYCQPVDSTPTWALHGTAGQRRNARMGRHPLGAPLADNGETCGTCTHMQRRRFNRTYLKCDLTVWTCGAATDTRARWPACTHWSPRDGS
jgi:hypothetical protein